MVASASRQDVPDLLPARMLNEFAYCPRLFYLEWVDGEWDDSADTVEGRYVHRRVDREGGALPAAGESADEEQPPVIHARSVQLSSPEEGLIARIDLVEGEGDCVTPVDYKRGAAPDVPGGAYEPERVQVCAQGLILRANGYASERGVLYFARSKSRVDVPFDAALVSRTRELASEARRVAGTGRAPAPLVDSPKCPRCSLVGICLPDEVNLLAGAREQTEADVAADGQPAAALTQADEEEPRARRLVAARMDALPLYVQGQGHRIGLHGDVLQVKDRDKVVGEARVRGTSQVALYGNVQMSTQALQACLAAEVPVCLYSYGGWFYGFVRGLDSKNVHLRMAQHAAARDERALAVARAFIGSKIRNARTLLRRNHEAAPDDVLRRLKEYAGSAEAATSAESLLGIEGTAARLYFEHFPGMLRPRGVAKDDQSGFAFDLDGRNRRPPRDPVNALLSFAYSLLAKDWTVTLAAVGFDPLLGFYHRPRYGRPALSLDMMEEFRPIIADSVVLSAINTGVVSLRDFERRGGAVALTSSGRKSFLLAYERRMDELFTHPLFDYRLSWRRVFEVQARLLARYLLGELGGRVPTLRVR